MKSTTVDANILNSAFGMTDDVGRDGKARINGLKLKDKDG